MEHRGPDAAVRQNLLDRLLHAVKQVQVHYGARQEIATESDIRVSTLCTEWEAVLLNGQRKPKPKPSLRITPSTRSGGSLGNLWQLAKLSLSPEETRRFLELEHVTSEIGRGRAWLRAAINERTLENYLHTILASSTTLREMYVESAFILDLERGSMLPVMAAGLSSIIFAIPIDAEYLNTPSRSIDVPPEATPPPLITYTPTLVDRMAENNDEGDDGDDVIAINAKEKRKKKRKSRSGGNSTERLQEVGVVQPNMEASPSESNSVKNGGSPGGGGADTPPIGESTSSSSSRLSIYDEGNSPMFVSLGTGGVSNASEAEAAVSATALVLSATTGQPVESVKGVEGVERGSGSQMSAEELREAVLVLVKAKEELEETNSRLCGQVGELEASRSQLLSELEASSSELQLLRDSHSTQLQALERENDLLTEQLKKYVGMVQTQRRDTNSETVVPSLSEASDAGGQEQKLIKIAEMYAELMELNERLHKTVAGKDTVITSLVTTLRQEGLEIPVSADCLPPGALQPKSLVDVWIPSAIKKGRGPDIHHVYQVFIRVRNEEWNVYRRYAEFREFHLQLAKHLPQVNSFEFPPRRTRNKAHTHTYILTHTHTHTYTHAHTHTHAQSAQVVEERRLKLQDYVRQVIQLCSSPTLSTIKSKKQSGAEGPPRPILQADVTKASLVHLFPFFRENLYVESQTSKPPSDPLYSGL